MRQMGGAYAYSFDITVLLFGACFNLAGLPYSAGFLGKEFLLFQVLRDDFTSLFVRGCWMVSFFFTPIYMFILVFIVSFGTKKGTLAAYASAWYVLYSSSSQSIINALSSKSSPFAANLRVSDVKHKLSYRFQHTALTSRLTIYILAVFWCFFFFFGESLLLLTFNYNTLTDLIPSSFFVFTKSHVIFNTFSSNALVGDTIFFFIVFFTTSSVAFLLNLRFTFSYSYTRATSIIDLAACAIIGSFFPLLFVPVISIIIFWVARRKAAQYLEA